MVAVIVALWPGSDRVPAVSANRRAVAIGRIERRESRIPMEGAVEVKVSGESESDERIVMARCRVAGKSGGDLRSLERRKSKEEEKGEGRGSGLREPREGRDTRHPRAAADPCLELRCGPA
jgi:hypothetical protein